MDTDGSSLSRYLWACDELTNAKKKSKEIHILNRRPVHASVHVRTYTID